MIVDGRTTQWGTKFVSHVSEWEFKQMQSLPAQVDICFLPISARS